MMTPDTATCTIRLMNNIVVAKVVATRWETVIVDGDAHEMEFAFVAVPNLGMVWVPPMAFVGWMN